MILRAGKQTTDWKVRKGFDGRLDVGVFLPMMTIEDRQPV
jgi:hypothetical protein